MFKILQKIMIVVLVTTCFMNNAKVYSRDSEVSSYGNKEELDFLLTVGILDKDPNSERLDEKISRGEFAGVLTKMLGQYNVADTYDGDIPFKDVHPMSIQAGSIMKVYQLGLMDGKDNLFKPDDTVLVEEALKALVNLTGYKLMAIQKGGYPIGYFQVAEELGILKDITLKEGSEITKEILFKLAYNTLQVDLMDEIGFGTAKSYEVKKDWNILNKYLDIYKVEGQITATNHTKIYSDTDLPKSGEIEINEKRYLLGTVMAEQYLGYMAECYVKHNDMSDEDTIIWLKPDMKKTEVITVESENIKTVKNTVFVEYWKGAEKSTRGKVKLKDTSNIIYNGKYYDKCYNINDSLLKPQYGRLKFVDADGDGVSEIVFVENIRTMVVEGVNHTEMTIVGKNDETLEIGNSNDIHLKVMSDGEEVTLKSVVQWDVLEIAESMDHKVIFIDVINKRISGTITALNDEELAVDDQVYKIASSYNNHKDELKLGKEGIFCLNARDQVAIVNFSSKLSDQHCGILLNAQLSKGLGKQLDLKIFDEKGGIIRCKTEPKIKLDGAESIKSDVVLSSLKGSSGSVTRNLITYTLNKNGNIDVMDTIKVNSQKAEIELKEDVPLTSLLYKSIGTFGMAQFMVTKDTTIFSVPTDLADEEKFEVIDQTKLSNDATYQVKAYNLNDFKAASAVIVLKDYNNTTPKGDANMLVVSNFVRTLKENQEIISFRGYYGGKPSDGYWCDAKLDKISNISLSSIQSGDTIQVDASTDGEIYSIRLLVNAEKRKVFWYAKDTVSMLSTAYGTVSKINKGANIALLEIGNDGASDERVFNLSGCTVYKYNAKSKNVGLAAISDISPRSKLFIRERYQEPKEIIIFE